jgi:hypothetical protein
VNQRAHPFEITPCEIELFVGFCFLLRHCA